MFPRAPSPGPDGTYGRRTVVSASSPVSAELQLGATAKAMIVPSGVSGTSSTTAG
nr:hypothetical protein CPGR_01282 [Mycolicibacter nonchromogenicus]